MSEILMTWGAYPTKSKREASDAILERSRNRQLFYELAVKMQTLAKERGLRLVMENPWGMHSFLQRAFITPPAFIDKDRTLRGDLYVKPTAYWFINCEPTHGFTMQQKHIPLKIKKDAKKGAKAGTCSEDRSLITEDYARNFICDFILGKAQPDINPTLFDAV